MKKRVLSLFLAITLCLTLTPTGALAAEGHDPEKFVDFYSANGWKQGKNKPIVDWKAAVRTWERSDAQQKAQDQNRVRTSAEYREEADFFG